jgi:preprotein translocase subunit SecB
MSERELNGSGATDGPQIGLQKVYLKDASFESPNSPAIFTGEWKPAVTLNISTRATDLGSDSKEVVLEISAEAKQNDTVAFLVELQQAGIFTLRGFDESGLERMLTTYCPAQLYPYAREVIADMVGKGGFPQLHLQPVNFEAMVAQARAGASSDDSVSEGATL